MTQLETSQPSLGFRRNAPRTAITLPGVQETIETPGLAVPTVDTRDAQLASEIISAIGGVGQVAGQIGSQANREAAQIRQSNLEHERIDRGAAAADAATLAPELIQKIHDGKIIAPPGVPIADYARQLARAQGGPEHSDAYNNEIQNRLSDNIAQAIVSRNARLTAADKLDATSLTVQSLSGKTEGFDNAIDAVKKINPDYTDRAARDAVLLPNLQVAAQTGNSEAFAAIVKRMPAGENTYDIARQQAVLDAQLHKQQADQLDTFKNKVADMIQSGLPLSVVRDKIESMRGALESADVLSLSDAVTQRENAATTAARIGENQARLQSEQALKEDVAGNLIKGDLQGARSAAFGGQSKGVASTAIEAELEKIDAIEKSYLTEGKRIALTTEEASIRSKFSATNDAMVQSGLGGLIRTQKVDRSDGKNVELTRAEGLQASFESAFQKIDQQGLPDQDALNQKIKLASRNAYVPADWNHLIESGGTAATQAALNAVQGGVPVEIPPSVLPAYDLYRQLNTKAEGLLDSAALSTRTKELFGTASVLQEYGIVQTPLEAVRNAAATIARPVTPADEIKTKELVTAFGSQKDVQIARDAFPLAKALIRNGIPPATAAEKAKSIVEANRIKINGWSSRIGNIPPDMKDSVQEIGEGIVKQFHARFKEGLPGVDASDLTLRYNPNQDVWELINGQFGTIVQPPTKNPDDVIFTTDKLLERAREVTDHFSESNKQVGARVFNANEYIRKATAFKNIGQLLSTNP